MYKPGDLVVVIDDCKADYFAGKTALIIKVVGRDNKKQQFGNYYKIRLDNGNEHILTHRELILLSKAGKNYEDR